MRNRPMNKAALSKQTQSVQQRKITAVKRNLSDGLPGCRAQHGSGRRHDYEHDP